MKYVIKYVIKTANNEALFYSRDLANRTWGPLERATFYSKNEIEDIMGRHEMDQYAVALTEDEALAAVVMEQ